MSASPERPALPDVWIHRTPERIYYGPLDAAPDAARPRGRAEPLLGRLLRGARGALTGATGAGAGWLHVLGVLVRTDFRARYRGQALGVLWSILYPLVMMGIMSLIFTQVFVSRVKHFPIYVLIGLLFWQWATSSVTAATQVFVSHADVIKRTVFPRQLLPMAMVLSYGINFFIESLALLAFVPIFPQAFQLSPALLCVPILLLCLAVLLMGVALATSVLHVIYRDVAYIVNTALLLLYWLTPIIYPVDAIPDRYRAFIEHSPLSVLLSALRRAIMDGQAPDAAGWGLILLPTMLIFALGWALFLHYERTVLDYV